MQYREHDTDLVLFCRRVCSHAVDPRACTLAADILIDVSPVMKTTMKGYIERFIEQHGGWRDTPWWDDVVVAEGARVGLQASWSHREPRFILNHVRDNDFLNVAAQFAPSLTRAAVKFIAWDPEGEPLYRLMCVRATLSPRDRGGGAALQFPVQHNRQSWSP